MQYSEWSERVASQANGFYAWFSLVSLLSIVAIALIRRLKPNSNPRAYIRIAAVILFYASLLALSPESIPALVATPVILAIAYHWINRIPAPLFILLSATLARIPFLFKPLWYDETFTAALARADFSNMLTVAAADVHPPTYYAIEWLIAHTIGSSEAALRLPAFIAGCLIPLAIYRLSRNLFWDYRAALASGLIVAFLPAAVYYSAEARAYSLIALLIIVCLIAIMEDRPALFAGSALLLPILHALGYFHAAALVLIVLVYRRRRNWLYALIPMIAAGAAYLPLLLQQSKDVSNGFWLTFTPVQAFQLLINMSLGVYINDSQILHLSGLIIFVTIASLFTLRNFLKSRHGEIIAIAILAAPIAAAIISSLWKPIFLDRALLAAPVLLALFWGYALTRSHAGDRLTLALIFIPSLFLAYLGMYTEANRAPMGDYIKEGCRGIETIYTTSTAFHFIADYYQPEDTALYIWNGANDLNQTLPDEAKTALNWQQIAAPNGDFCLLFYKTMLSTEAEAAHIESLLENASDYRPRVFVDNGLTTLTIYRVEKP